MKFVKLYSKNRQNWRDISNLSTPKPGITNAKSAPIHLSVKIICRDTWCQSMRRLKRETSYRVRIPMKDVCLLFLTETSWENISLGRIWWDLTVKHAFLTWRTDLNLVKLRSPNLHQNPPKFNSKRNQRWRNITLKCIIKGGLFARITAARNSCPKFIWMHI